MDSRRERASASDIKQVVRPFVVEALANVGASRDKKRDIMDRFLKAVSDVGDGYSQARDWLVKAALAAPATYRPVVNMLFGYKIGRVVGALGPAMKLAEVERIGFFTEKTVAFVIRELDKKFPPAGAGKADPNDPLSILDAVVEDSRPRPDRVLREFVNKTGLFARRQTSHGTPTPQEQTLEQQRAEAQTALDKAWTTGDPTLIATAEAKLNDIVAQIDAHGVAPEGDEVLPGTDVIETVVETAGPTLQEQLEAAKTDRQKAITDRDRDALTTANTLIAELETQLKAVPAATPVAETSVQEVVQAAVASAPAPVASNGTKASIDLAVEYCTIGAGKNERATQIFYKKWERHEMTDEALVSQLVQMEKLTTGASA